MTNLPNLTAEEQEIAERLEKATPGLWVAEVSDGYITGHVVAKAHKYAGNTVSRRDSVTAPESMTIADANLIAHAPTDIRSLLETVDGLRGALRSVESLVEFYSKREMKAPGNSQEACQEAWERLERFRKALAR